MKGIISNKLILQLVLPVKLGVHNDVCANGATTSAASVTGMDLKEMPLKLIFTTKLSVTRYGS